MTGWIQRRRAALDALLTLPANLDNAQQHLDQIKQQLDQMQNDMLDLIAVTAHIANILDPMEDDDT